MYNMDSNAWTLTTLFLFIFICHWSSSQGPLVCLGLEYAPDVQLTGGLVRGIVQEVQGGTKVHLYQGIRYGRATRFAKPVPVEPWTGVYNATTFRFACPQPGIGQVTDQTDNSISSHSLADNITSVSNEDCLFLNVWRPTGASNSNAAATFPVMVWLHGGGFYFGTSFSKFYDARYIASLGQVVVVTLNYRLGALGFLYSGTDKAPGNVGLYDQLLALQWVQNNIANFGGDPHKVTIFGQSAGSISIASFMLSPLSKGLFHRAIMQSGGPIAEYGPKSKSSVLQMFKKFATRLNCPATEETSASDTLQCLLSKSTEEIVKATYIYEFLPIYGDELIPDSASKLLLSTQSSPPIDLMYGVTKDELLFSINNTELTTREQVEQLIMRLVHNETAAKLYTTSLDLANAEKVRQTINLAYSDYSIICPTVLFGELYARQRPNNRFYSYQLVQPISHTVALFDNVFKCQPSQGVCHGIDLIYLFGAPIVAESTATGQYSANEQQLSRDMITSWTSFAKTGDPGMMGSVRWEEAFGGGGGGGDGGAANRTESSTRLMLLDSSAYRMEANMYRDKCNKFWKPVLFQQQ